MKYPLSWFKIGKTVYRKPRPCNPHCDMCPQTEIKIPDKATSYNMHMAQFSQEINYYDKPL